MINHIPYTDISNHPLPVRGVVADSLDSSFGKVSLASRYEDAEGTKPNSFPKQQTGTLKNMRKISAPLGPYHKNAIIEWAVSDPKNVSLLKPKAVSLLPSSVFKRNIAALTNIRDTSMAKEAEAQFEVKEAHKNFYEAIKGIANSHGLSLSKELKESDYLNEKGEVRELPEEFKAACGESANHVEQQYRHIAHSLKAIAGLKEYIEETKSHIYINQVAEEVAHHPSYRALMRWVNPEMREKLMGWLNVIGMVTMILTIPLMWEGLKQWGQSVMQPQGGGSPS